MINAKEANKLFLEGYAEKRKEEENRTRLIEKEKQKFLSTLKDTLQYEALELLSKNIIATAKEGKYRIGITIKASTDNSYLVFGILAKPNFVETACIDSIKIPFISKTLGMIPDKWYSEIQTIITGWIFSVLCNKYGYKKEYNPHGFSIPGCRTNVIISW